MARFRAMSSRILNQKNRKKRVVSKKNNLIASSVGFAEKNGCFGKNRVSKNYIRHHVQAAEISALEKMVQGAVAQLIRNKRDDISQVLKKMPRFYFMLTGLHEDHIIGGIMSPSKDSVGMDFPFVVFKHLIVKNVKRLKAIAPIVLHEFYEKSAQLLSMDWTKQTLENLLMTIDAAPRSQLESDGDELFENMIDLYKNISISSYWQSLQKDCSAKEKALFITALMSAIKTVVIESPDKTPWGLRIPLPNGELQWPYISFFIQLVETMLRKVNWSASIFWHDQSAQRKPSMTVFFSPMTVPGISALIDPSKNTGAIIDIKKKMSSTENPAQQAIEIANRSELDLMDSLYCWSGFG